MLKIEKGHLQRVRHTTSMGRLFSGLLGQGLKKPKNDFLA
jgi:hypothetical protein